MIRGFFDPEEARRGRLVPVVRAALSLPTTGKSQGIVYFLIDTGADESILHPADAVSLGFATEELLTEHRDWGPREEIFGIGGKVATHRVRALFIFAHQDGLPLKTIDGYIHVAMWTPENQGLPSLLGWNVLRYFRLSLDWDNRLIALRDRTD